jgi:LmbE family N-acetylglucosaminyl deacetylase
VIAAKNILVVAAHPDDEALGCGGTIARLAAEGCNVRLLFLADGENARSADNAGSIAERRSMAIAAAEALGAVAPTCLEFPDNRLDSVDLLDLVQPIERHADALRPDVVFTHFPGDLNVDHRLCSQAVLTAFRPVPGQTVRSIFAFEVPSSTEWQFGAADQGFSPNAFFDISDHLEAKRAALRAYSKEMRPYPHARSIEAVEALARWRGATIGVEAAEAFMVLRTII